MIDTLEKKKQIDLSPLPQNLVVKMKLGFKADIEHKIQKLKTDRMSESHINAVRSYITVQMLNRIKLPAKKIEEIACLDEKVIREKIKTDANPYFSEKQRQATKKAARERYKKYGHGIFGTHHRRLYFPLIPTVDKSETEISVEAYLNKKGYFIRDYVRGYATDMEGKQEYKIGKLIKKGEELSKEFMTDSTRLSDNQCLVLSDYANDIAYMSTRRGWESCMSHDGVYRDRPPNDIEHGTIVGYLINKKDPYIFDPLARVLLKPLYSDKGDVSYHVNKCYGLHHGAFKETAERVAEQISSTVSGLFKIPERVYSDNAPSEKLVLSDDIGTEEFLDILEIKYNKSSSGESIIVGDLIISSLGLKKLPDLTNVKVMGNFSCFDNELESLIGSPQEVDGDFSCGHNNLETLHGAPQKVTGDFSCYSNALMTLEDGPREVGGDYNCSYNNLTDLFSIARKLGGSLSCNGNKLTSLLGAPKEIIGSLNCSENNLTSLKYGPEKVGGDVNINYNKLTSLTHAPQEVGGSFSCNSNELITLSGAPQKLEHGFHCDNNKLTNLLGGPQEVLVVYYCEFNELTSLEGAPKVFDGRFSCLRNKLTSLIGLPEKMAGVLDCHHNELKSLMGLPKGLKGLYSDFGSYYDINKIPKRYFKESRGRNFIRKARESLSI